MFQNCLLLVFLFVVDSYILSSKYLLSIIKVFISKWATYEAVGIVHFATLVARLASFHDLLNLTPDI